MHRRSVSLQELIRRRQSGGFVGRQEELAQFQDNLRLPVDDVRRRFLFSVHGDAGIGKTFLLRQFIRLAREAGCLTAYVDETVYDIPAALEAVSADLAQQDAHCKEFAKRAETYRKHQYELDSDPAAPEGLSSALTRSAVRIGLRAAEDIPLVGPFAKELNTDAVAGQVDRLRSYLNGKLRNHHDVRLMLSPVEVLTPLFVADLGEIAAERPVVLFFDTYERTGAFLDAWLRTLLSGRYGDLPANLVLVLAGQHPLDVNAWGDYLAVRSDIALEVFTEPEAVQLLAARGVTDKGVVDVVLGLTGRLPVLVAMLAEARPGNVEEVSDPSDNAVERFLKWESDSRRRESALLGALPRRLDRETYAAATGADEDFAWLLSLPFVAERAGGYRYHDVVRNAMLRVQRRRSSAEWRARHEKLAEHYRVSVESHDLAGAWRDERFQVLAIEEAYHRLCAHPSAALPPVLESLVDTLDENPEFVPRWTAMIRQAGEDSGTPALARHGEELTTSYADEKRGRLAFCTSLAENTALDSAHRALAYGERGALHQGMKEYEKAVADFTRALELDENLGWARAFRGDTYRDLNRYDDSVADLSRVIEAKPDYRWAIGSRGSTYRLMGRYAEALADFERVLELDPEFDWAKVNRGIVLRVTGRFTEALTVFDDVLAHGRGQLVGARSPWRDLPADGTPGRGTRRLRARARIRAGRRLRAGVPFPGVPEPRPLRCRVRRLDPRDRAEPRLPVGIAGAGEPVTDLRQARRSPRRLRAGSRAQSGITRRRRRARRDLPGDGTARRRTRGVRRTAAERSGRRLDPIPGRSRAVGPR
ncbi:Tetratricopeptide (TPR) repeat [Amycolatopsis australiensis]|uniref:Tetratricopeptide (TPR) repeat n=1 Tax=Amycolatopsis australiensis TaxID=546364 RepID=A0A1K1RT09_9PSEU|nr:tetratricopeptide repeat protein [Amycolatopsis australiensis]SFW75280.1 Tetratricopeptide (TPR) repeat [Amycolatopsis australiensis]